MSDNIQLIEALYAAFRGGDHAEFARLCTDDLEWIQNEGFPYGGNHHGAQAVIDGVFLALPRHWDGFRFQIDEMWDAGQGVVVLGVYEGRHRETGRAFRAAAAHVYDIRDGRVSRFRQYTDTALIRDAAQAE